MTRFHRIPLIVSLAALSLLPACGKKASAEADEDIPIRSRKSAEPAATVSAAPSAVASAAPSAAATASAVSTAPPTSRKTDDFPLDDIKTIADDCAEAWAVMTVITPALRNRSPDWLWNGFVQALYSDPRFMLVGGQPSGPMQIAILEGKHGEDNYALWARCSDGATCNKLAAMYRFVTPTARPWVYCGKGDQKVDRMGSKVLFASRAALEAESRAKLDKSVESQCHRIGICYLREKGQDAKEMGRECQMKPSTFTLACSRKPSCSEVVSCVAK